VAEAVVLHANEALFDVMLARYYAAHQSEFAGSVPAEDLDALYEFAATARPTIDLSPRTDGANVAIVFSSVTIKMYDYAHGQRGQLTETDTVGLTMTGTLGLSGQSLALSSLTSTATGSQDARAAARVIDKRLIPQYQAEVQNMPLPDLRRLLGFAVTVTGLTVANHLVQVRAQLGSPNDPAPGWSRAPMTQAGVIAAISDGGINDLLSQVFHGVSREADAPTTDTWFVGFRAGARASAENPRITIRGGTATGSIQVSAGVSAGVETAGHWTDVPISISVSTPPIGLRLVTDNAGKSAVLTFYLNGTVALHSDLPSILGKFADSVLGVIDSVANEITTAINEALDRIRIVVFTLPDTIPGTKLSATLKFDALEVSGNSVIAAVLVT